MVSSDTCITSRQFLAKYEEKENIPLEDFELGRIVKEVFPDVQLTEFKSGLTAESLPGTTTSEKFQCKTLVVSSSDKIEWLNLPSEISQFGWQLTNSNPEFYE